MNINKSEIFFKVPHHFEEYYGDKLRPSEKYFFIILLKLENRFAKDGWFWHADKKFPTKDGRHLIGFGAYGFSTSFCKRTRKKLKALDIIETKYGWNKLGHRAATFYRIKYEKFNET